MDTGACGAGRPVGPELERKFHGLRDMKGNTMDCDICGRAVKADDDAYCYQVIKPDGAVEPYSATHAECVDMDAHSKGQRVRVTCDGTDFSRATAKIIQPDGTEIPFSSIMTACTIRIADNRLNTAVITFEGVELEVAGTTTNPVYITSNP